MRRDVRKDRARSLRDADLDSVVLPEAQEPERAVRRLHLIQNEPTLVITVHFWKIALCCAQSSLCSSSWSSIGIP